MRTFKSLMISLCMGTTICMCLRQIPTAQTVSSGDSWTWDRGTIVIDTPERPTGQKSVLGLTPPKMEVVRVGSVSYTHLDVYKRQTIAYTQSTMYKYLQRHIRTSMMDISYFNKRKFTSQYHLTETCLSHESYFLRSSIILLCAGM